MRTAQAVCESTEERFDPTPTRDCSWWCPFFQVCPLMDDGTIQEDHSTDRMFTDLYHIVADHGLADPPTAARLGLTESGPVPS